MLMRPELDINKTLLDNLYEGVYFVDRERKITYWNKGAERITGYTAQEVLGKSCSDDILMHVDMSGNALCEENCPVLIVLQNGHEQNAEMFLQHKNGHRIPVNMRLVPLRDADNEIIGGIEIFTISTPAATAIDRLAELEKIAFLDGLTGLANRRYAEITLNARLEELERYGWKFGVLFIDIDFFKTINDVYGHDVGDDVLIMVGNTLRNSVRPFDIVSRWGGEEYLAVIIHVTKEELALTANRCRFLVQQSNLPSVPHLRVTVSLGGTLARPEDTVSTLFKRVDRLMYRSKETGRNRVTIE